MINPSLRSLPRLFVEGATAEGPIDLPKDEVDKLRKVLRLSSGAQIAILPNDGTVIRSIFRNHTAEPIEVLHPASEPERSLIIAQALPKGDKLDEIVRACTEIGAAEFLLFPSDRTVVKWDDAKTTSRIRRLETIAREAAEVCFRTRIPRFSVLPHLRSVLTALPFASVLSEVEDESKVLPKSVTGIVVGPEGGWSPRELELIGNRGVTLGPRVLRVDHAAPAAAAILLLRHG